MHRVEILYGGAMEEISSAKEYSEYAVKYRGCDEELYKFFMNLAGTEMEHAKGFISHLERVVEDIPERDDRFDELMAMLMASLNRQLAEARAAYDLAK